MPWFMLIVAIAAEVTATAVLKVSDGLSRLVPTTIVVAGYLLSFVLLAQVVKHLQVSTAYAIWSGLGTAAICIIGMLALDEPLTAAKAIGILMVIGGVVTLNLSGAA